MTSPDDFLLPAVKAFLEKFQRVFEGTTEGRDPDATLLVGQDEWYIHFDVLEGHSEALMNRLSELSGEGESPVIHWQLDNDFETAEVVNAMFRYCYLFDYPDGGMPKDLRLHFKVFALAQKYEIHFLALIAGAKFRALAEQHIFHEAFVEVMKASQQNEFQHFDPDRAFSRMVAEIVAMQHESLSPIDEKVKRLAEALIECPRLSVEVLEVLQEPGPRGVKRKA